MREAYAAATVMLFCLAAAPASGGESTWEFSVQLSASVQTNGPSITLNWPQDSYMLPNSYTVYRKPPGGSSWGTGIRLAGTATSYLDTNVSVGAAYEYQVVKNTSLYTGYGYIYAGMRLPLAENRGRLLLVVDNTYALELTNELSRLQQDLTGDGWLVTRLDVNRNDSVTTVKSLIKAQYQADPFGVKAVFLFGHVPVPYSGNIVPDGHLPDHQGAWPCDGYYGDIDGVWTDNSVNVTGSGEARTRNVPGDGKFDQSNFPAPIRLMVGRVDLANMPGRLTWGGPATFPSELELLRNYLNKDHKFRHKQFDLPRKAILGDYFGVRDGEAFAASGWRNLASFFGAANLSNLPDQGTWVSTLATNACLWAYGCGSGSYTSIGGLGNTGIYHDAVTTEVVGNDIKSVFTLLFGSWLGDWDSEDNIQRSILALPSYGLACAWSGRPHWFLQHMALGEPIGFGARLTQNNGPSGLYQNQVNSCAGQTHIALMGDPTLRMHTVAPPGNLQGMTNSGTLTLTWSPSAEQVEGYHVYRAPNQAGPFSRVSSALLTTTSYLDPNPPTGATYMVRAVKLENSASGSYYNPSQGIFLSMTSIGDVTQNGGSTKDTNAPAVSIISPTPNTTLSGAAVSLSAVASHPSGIASVQFKVDGTNVGSELTSAPFSVTWDTRGVMSGQHVLTAIGRDNTGKKAVSAPVPVLVANEIAARGESLSWVNDTLPPGAVPANAGGDSWSWTANNPTPFSGTLAHSSIHAPGMHQHFFTGASSRLLIGSGDVLYAHVYLDPSNPPRQVMLQWNDGSWEHRAYWGANLIPFGTLNTPGRHYMGALPAPGQWVRLEVPAALVNLEGASVNGMAFTLYDGRAWWDDAGKNFSSTSGNPPGSGTNTAGVDSNSLPGVGALDYLALELPKVGSNSLSVLTPNLLELKLINTKQPDPARVTAWDWVNANSQFTAPPLNAFSVTANGQPIGVLAVGFKRRPLYAPLTAYDLRIENCLYLQLAAPVSDNQVIEVKNPDRTLWNTNLQFVAQAHPLRYNAAIHINQEGYMPNFPKKGMVGHYSGSLGETVIPTAGGFNLVDAKTGAQVYQGSLTTRADVGYQYIPTPYQKVYEADFSAYNVPGEYRLVVPGMGGSAPFKISEGIGMAFARAYALGLYHQRCGTDNSFPYTRFTHAKCHAAPASVPLPASSFPFSWRTISNYSQIRNDENPDQIAPDLISPAAQRFPFVRQGTVDVSGGHHDAGDYSKYTANSASFIHYLMFAVDSFPGVASLDNLGLPESGDGISDIMQEAKWEADFLAKLQDTDGGFYFLVYPKDREYEGNVLPENGDPQVVWPKTTSVTAASVAALAQCASSPLFKQAYPATAALYLDKARLGWQFLMNSIARFGKNGGYQKITHYADDYADKDELAWAACQMYLATGDAAIHQQLLAWFDPADPATRRWGWWHMSQCYGHAIRAYAFAAPSGRISSSQLNASFLGKCQAEIAAAGDDVLKWSDQNAYGTSFPEETKHFQAAGWYFSTDQAFDLAVAYQLNPKSSYIAALVANMNYEGGCNPVNVSFVTGLGWKRQRDIVHQYAPNDRRVLPPSGIPVGNIVSVFGYLFPYQGDLEKLCFPPGNAQTAPYPFYDRWGDSWNVTAEFVILNSARSLGTLSFLAAQTSLKTQPWKAASGQILVPLSTVAVGAPLTLSFQAPGVDLTGAKIVWEARDQEPAFGSSFTLAPRNNGPQWVEAEAQLPDGRRVFAQASFAANSPDIVWVDDAMPAGASPGADGGDLWAWAAGNPAPISGTLAHQSALASGSHQHFFDGASSTLSIGTGDVLYAYVFLDALNPPSQLMLQWNDGSWDHRAYWGANKLGYGQDGTPGRRYMGPLPAFGQWTQLKVPANLVNLEGSTLKGMAFTLFGGRATWDAAGRLASTPTDNSSPAATLSLTASGPMLQWKTTPNRSYRISYKNDLGEPTWIVAANITAAGTNTSWIDQGASQASRRFYSVTSLN